MSDKIVIRDHPAPTHQPWAVHFPPGLSDDVLAEIAALAPGNACPVHLAIAKRTAKDMIDALAETARGAEVRIECTGYTGHQILIQVVPALVKKP